MPEEYLISLSTKFGMRKIIHYENTALEPAVVFVVYLQLMWQESRASLQV